jgi:predicted MFS family arabinose efflux permease
MGASIGQLLGPAIAAVIVGGAIVATVSAPPDPAVTGNREGPVFLFAALATTIALALAFGLPRLPPARLAAGSDQPGLGHAAARVLRRSGMRSAMFVSIAVITTLDVLIAYLPAYGVASGIGIETIALLLAVRGGASLVSRAFMTQLIDLLGRKRLLAFSTGLAGASLALLPFITAEVVLFPLMAIVGLGIGLGQPMTIAWVANRSPREERGLALGIRLTGNRSALLLVPTAMGLIAGASGIGAVFVAMALVLLVGAFIAWIAPFDEPLPDRQAAGGRDPG